MPGLLISTLQVVGITGVRYCDRPHSFLKCLINACYLSGSENTVSVVKDYRKTHKQVTINQYKHYNHTQCIKELYLKWDI
jgi:hypothetical protein